MLKTTSSFVQVTKETAPKLIERLQKGEGSNVFYGVMKNGKPTLHSGQSITSPKTRQAVIDKITSYVNKLENKATEKVGESFITIA